MRDTTEMQTLANQYNEAAAKSRDQAATIARLERELSAAKSVIRKVTEWADTHARTRTLLQEIFDSDGYAIAASKVKRIIAEEMAKVENA